MSNDQPPTPDDPGAQPRRDDLGGDPHPFFGRVGRQSQAAPAARERSVAPASPHPSPDPFGDDDEFASWFDDEPPRPAPVAGPPGGSSWPSADDDVPPVTEPPRHAAPQLGPNGLPQRVPGASGARSLTADGTGAPGPVPFSDGPPPFVPAQPGQPPAQPRSPGQPGSGMPAAHAGEPGPGAPGAGLDDAGYGPPPGSEPVAHPIEPAAATESGALPPRVGRRRLIAGFGTPEAAPVPVAPTEEADAESDAESGDQTMTTRVSIKIPGSRPIPPVVLRGQAPLPSQEAPRWTRDGEGEGPYEYQTRQEQDAADHGFPQYGNTDAHATETGAGHPDDTGEHREEARPAPARPARRKPKALIACAAGLAVLGGVYGASLAYAGGGVPRGTSVLGVNIGGQSRDEAVRTLEQKLGDRTTKPIKLTLAGKQLELAPAVAGLLLDARATVSEASKGGMNPLTSVPAMFGKTREAAPRTVVDPVKLGAELEALAAEAGGAQTDGGISFAGGQAAAVAPSKGKVLDTPAAIKLVEAAFLHGTGPVELPTKAADPKVNQAEVDRAMREFAVPAMSGPVTLTAGNKSQKLTPIVLAKYLTMVPDGSGRLQPKIDVNGLQDELGQTFSSVGEKPKNATFKVEGKLAAGAKVSVVPSVAGKGVSGATAADALLSVLSKTGAARTAKVNLGPVEPELTTEAANKLGITEVMSTYTTNYPYAAYRLTNIHRAADLITGSVIKPGETWSLNKTVGERTAENGFAKGTIINNGRFQTDFGGGVSQVATTTFNAVFFAGLKDVMHRPHSFWIDRYPAGREATVAWPSLDLKFQNDSGRHVYLESTYTDSTVTVTLLGTRKYDDIKAEPGNKYDVVKPKSVVDKSAGCVEQAASDGFKIDVTRVFFQGGKETAREKFHTKYDPADKITCDRTGGGEGEGQGRTADAPPAGGLPVRASDD
ncbi:VanW family protein [Embleya sp. NBC_00888]|uniref:VanW family protein n=1 Tax=Embleya sp. NBC_00888 TaxID=2975960 RepID=UPI003866B512|nr:VanW family protein [Embleya sp. NBC_00888]